MTTIFCRITCMLVLSITAVNATGQSFAINTDGSTANASALLDIKSTNKGVLIPRMSKAEKNAIAVPATGLLIFQNAPDSVGFYYYNGSGWTWLSNASTNTAWFTTGNLGTDTAVNFIGTRTSMPLRFKQNNGWVGQFDTNTENVYLGGAAGERNRRGLRNTIIGDSALAKQSFDAGFNYVSANTAIGSKALYNNQPTNSGNGIRNVAIGNEAMMANTTGHQNVAVGVSALRENLTGIQNVAIGKEVMIANTTGHQNVAIGESALRENLTGFGNVALGKSAARLSKSGSLNSYVGFSSGFSDSSGDYNIGIGAYSMYSHIVGDNNVSIGNFAMWLDSIGQNNTAIGTFALQNNDTAKNVTAIGYRTLHQNNRNNITALGAHAGYWNGYFNSNPATGIENTMIGYAAMYGVPWGSKNTAIGHLAMARLDPSINGYGTIAPNRNVAIGDSSLYLSGGDDNVAIGFKAASSQNSPDASQNVAIGSKALHSNIRGSGKVAIGYEALYTDTLSTAFNEYNTAIGYQAIRNSRFSELNTAVGAYALLNAGSTGTPTTPAFNGGFNTAMGVSSLLSTTTGFSNTAMGAFSGSGNTTGIGNVAIGTFANNGGNPSTSVSIGYFAGTNNNGSNNTFIGWGSGDNNTTGSSNTTLGGGANVIGVALTNATAIGANATVAQSNSLILGSSGTNVGIGINAPNTKLHIDGGTDANIAIATSGYLLMGDATGANLVMDDNEIISRNNGAAATLYLQYQSGNVVIGANTAGSHKLSVNGDAAKVGGGTWAAYSDSRLKKNVTPYSDGLSSLLKINPVRYNYNEVSGYDTQKTYIGVIAQELQQVSPYMVSPLSIKTNDATPYLQVDNSAMIYMLINSVKEQQTQITETKKEIRELKNFVLQQQQIINKLQKQ